jgi:hypothetical protein
MSLRTPYLDDRKFQEIVDELKSRIPLYCPEWTDHNVSDPGVTLIELFAYLAEQLIFRMNQVPDLHYMRFVQFLGIPIPTPQPAHVAITFWLSKPLIAVVDEAGQAVPINAGTQVSTTQTETTPALLFTIGENARIHAPQIVNAGKASRDSEPQLGLLRPLLSNGGVGVELFSATPRTGDNFTFYFANNLSYHILQLSLDLEDRRGTNIQTDQPPVTWEVFGENNEWQEVAIGDYEDDTKGLNKSGSIRLFLPKMARVQDPPGLGVCYGIRVRVNKEEYRQTPHLLRIRGVDALGITLNAAYQQEVIDENLGISDGSPGQRFRLNHEPVIAPFGPDETLAVAGDNEPWLYVDSFVWPQASRNGAPVPGLKCFTVDVMTNEICLPPAVKRPDGEIAIYGAVPARNAALSIRRYRYGGGALDIPRGDINVLKTSIPYIDRVENRHAAIGGQQGLPSIDALRVETQRYLRTGNRSRFVRAVTAEEFENLVLASFPEEVGKVECRLEQLDRIGDAQSQLEHLTVYVTAKLPVSDVLWGSKMPEVHAGVIAQIDQLLHQHRLLTSRVGAGSPRFIPLNVTINLLGARDAVLESRIQEITAAYLNPVYGGEFGFGWRLDQLCTSEQLIQHLKTAFRTAAHVNFRSVTIELQDVPAIFSVGADDHAAGVESLNNGAVGDQLMNSFRQRGYDLNRQTKARVRCAGSSWAIVDGNRKFLIRNNGISLEVYDYQAITLKAQLYILSSVKTDFE